MRDLPHLHDSDVVRSVRLTEETIVTGATFNSFLLSCISVTCACKPGCLLSLDWLHTIDCKMHDKEEHSQVQAGVCRLYPSDAPCQAARAAQGGPQGQGCLLDAQQPQGHLALLRPLLVAVEWQDWPAGGSHSICVKASCSRAAWESSALACACCFYGLRDVSDQVKMLSGTVAAA